jgi:hypothetical protein
MSMNPEENEQDHAPEEAAFNHASAGLEFDKAPLLPFSPARERAAQAMGMKAPAWKQEEFALIQGNGIYPGALRDATIFVWLCSIPTAVEQETTNMVERTLAKAQGRKPEFKSGWTVQRADRNPDEAYEEACRFCDEKGLVLGSSKFLDAYRMVVAKGLEILNSRFDIQGGEGGDESPNV